MHQSRELLRSVDGTDSLSFFWVMAGSVPGDSWKGGHAGCASGIDCLRFGSDCGEQEGNTNRLMCPTYYVPLLCQCGLLYTCPAGMSGQFDCHGFHFHVQFSKS
jgi:hypothetical protein